MRFPPTELEFQPVFYIKTDSPQQNDGCTVDAALLQIDLSNCTIHNITPHVIEQLWRFKYAELILLCGNAETS